MTYQARDYNRGVSDVVFKYFLCRECGLVFLGNPPDDIDPYYPDDYYSIPSSLKALAEEAVGQRYRIEMVRKFVQQGRLIEIGPGAGAFSYLAKESGFNVVVIERSKICCEFIKSTLGIETLATDNEYATLASVAPADVIVLWHVIEHLRDPWRLMELAVSKLNAGGILVISTPNPNSFQFRLFGRYWAHLDAPRHQWLIPSRVLVRWLRGLGLELELLTTNHGERDYNRFGWVYSIANVIPIIKMLGPVVYHLGRAITVIVSNWEETEGRGTSYATVFRKPQATLR